VGLVLVLPVLVLVLLSPAPVNVGEVSGRTDAATIDVFGFLQLGFGSHLGDCQRPQQPLDTPYRTKTPKNINVKQKKIVIFFFQTTDKTDVINTFKDRATYLYFPLSFFNFIVFLL
jgi:hypothetical protein